MNSTMKKLNTVMVLLDLICNELDVPKIDRGQFNWIGLSQKVHELHTEANELANNKPKQNEFVDNN